MEVAKNLPLAIGGDQEALGRLLFFTRRWIIRLLHGKFTGMRLDDSLEDLISIANVEILRYLPAYDPTKSAWTTWVAAVPFQAARRYMNHHFQPVHIPDGENTHGRRIPMRRGIPKQHIARKKIRSHKRNRNPLPPTASLHGIPVTVAQRIDHANDLHAAEARMANLTAIEKEVIRARYGMDGEPPVGLPEMARRMNTTRENIRYIELHALRKLRA